MVGYNPTSYFIVYRMRVLFLLASLCLPSLILSDFKEMVVNCTTEVENCNHTNSCEWNISLAMCSTLEIQCVETAGKSSQKKICSSLEECGLKKGLKFIDSLLGSIDCKNTDGEVKCSLAVACNHSIYLCEKAECELDHILSGSKNRKKHCKFHHNIAKCIKENGNFKGPINCTMKSATASNNDLGPNAKGRLEGTEQEPSKAINLKENTTNIPNYYSHAENTTNIPNYYSHAETVILRIVVEHLGFFVVGFLVFLCWRYKYKICGYRQGTAEAMSTGSIELQTLGNTERQAGAAEGLLDKHSQHQPEAKEVQIQTGEKPVEKVPLECDKL